MSADLTIFCELAAWAAQNRCREIFDGCGELFEKHDVEIESNSELGLRLSFFDIDRRLKELNQNDFKAFNEILAVLDTLTAFPAFEHRAEDVDELRSSIIYELGICVLAKTLSIGDLQRPETATVPNKAMHIFTSQMEKLLPNHADAAEVVTNKIVDSISYRRNIKKDSALRLLRQHSLPTFVEATCLKVSALEKQVVGEIKLFVEKVRQPEWTAADRDNHGPYAMSTSTSTAVTEEEEEDVVSSAPAKQQSNKKSNKKGNKRTAPVTEPESEPEPAPVAEPTKKHAKGKVAAPPTAASDDDQPSPIKDIKRTRQQLDAHTKGRDPLAAVLQETKQYSNNHVLETVPKASKRKPASPTRVVEAASPVASKRTRQETAVASKPTHVSESIPEPEPKRTRSQLRSADAAASRSAATTQAGKAVKSPARTVPTPTSSAKANSSSKKQVIQEPDYDSEDGIESVSSESTDAQHEYDVKRQASSSSGASLVASAAMGLQKLSATIQAARFPPHLSRMSTSPSKAASGADAINSSKVDAGLRHKWTEEEEEALLAGMRRYGTNWALILLDKDFRRILSRRTNVNLKDKARNLAKSA